jgi:type I restriction enzyme S subunit
MEKLDKIKPLLRFPAFIQDGGWKEYKLGDIAQFYKGKGISKNDVTDNGTIPCIRYGELYTHYKEVIDEVTSYTDLSIDDLFMSKANDIIIPSSGETKEDIATASCVLRNNVALGGDINVIRTSNNGVFLSYYLNNAKKHDIAKIAQGISIIHLYNEQLRNLSVEIPNLEEQQKIAECLSSIDSYISSLNEKVEQLKVHKKSLLQKLFPQRGQTVPEYRFSEFQKDSAWEKMKLGDVTTVINRRNKSNRSLPIYSISNKDGFVLQSEQFDGLDSESRGYDISLYKIVGRNTFAYNPARINIGSIGYSGDLKEVLISSLYVCFKTTNELDDEFLICFLKTAQFSQAVENNVEGGIRSYLFYENFSRINISIPSLQEQKKIASTILSIDDVISKYTDKVSLLEDYKKGLMQQLFPAITK